ncbi:MAG: hypothetical protein PHY02_02680 [Phycisphaerae bacterium]|nr:hypothetical protein [Phycisphaerae bacterium]
MRLVKLPFRQISHEWPPHPCVPIYLSNPLDSITTYCRTCALIDTGAVRSAIPDWAAKEVYHCHENTGVKKKEDAFGIVGAANVYEHTFDLKITDFNDKVLHNIEGIKFDVTVPKKKGDIIIPPPVILGLEDFILPYVDLIDFKKKCVVFKF